MLLPSPATLWGILISECCEEDKEPVYDEAEEYDSSDDAATTDVASQEGSETGRSSGTVTRSPAGPATLWGLLVSEADCGDVDFDTIVDLWLAAGYECQLPLEEEAPMPAAIDTNLTNDDDISTHHSYHPAPGLPIGPYIVQESPGKGRGIFATRFIHQGELILHDKPFLSILKPYNRQNVLSTFERMPLHQRRWYMQLSCPDRHDDVTLTDVIRIFEANCFNLGSSAAMFPTATRFNHSCLANTYYSWSDSLNSMVFHAMVSIPGGSELTICYGRPFRTCQERRSELRIYNFHCRCLACDMSTAFGRASESRRLEMRVLEGQIIACQSMLDDAPLSYGLRDPLTAILRLIELIKEEGLHGELMTPYRDAADHLKVRGNFREALMYAQLELEEEVTCLGEDSDVVASTRVYIADLEKMLVK